MKRKLSLLIAIIMAAAVFCACRDTKPADPTEIDIPTTEPTAEPQLLDGALIDAYNGDWYGVYTVGEAAGLFVPNANVSNDCALRVSVDGYGGRLETGTTCVVTGLTAETTYYFHVRATAGANTGQWSAEAKVATLAASVPAPDPGTAEAYDAWLAAKVKAGATAADLPYATASTDDYDNDGASNWEEYISDSDPTDAGDFLRIGIEQQADGTWLAKPVPSSTNRSYAITTRTDLTDDSTLSTTSFPAGSPYPAATIANDIWFGTVRVSLPE